MALNIIYEITWKKAKIYFNSILHLKYPKDDVAFIQAWTQGPSNYAIEITLFNGTKICIEYNSHEKWTEVLRIMDEIQEKN